MMLRSKGTTLRGARVRRALARCTATQRSSLQIPGSVCCTSVDAVCAMSFRRCRCRTCSSGMPQIPPLHTVSLRRVGLWSQCDALPWPPTSPTSRSMTPLDWLCRCGFPLGELVRFSSPGPRSRLVDALERDTVVPKLVDELCSLSYSRKLHSFSWNQHRPCHLVSPVTDVQHRSLVLRILPLQGTRDPLTWSTPSKSS